MHKSMDSRDTEATLFGVHKQKIMLERGTELICNRIEVLRREEERMLKKIRGCF